MDTLRQETSEFTRSLRKGERVEIPVVVTRINSLLYDFHSRQSAVGQPVHNYGLADSLSDFARCITRKPYVTSASLRDCLDSLLNTTR